MDRTKKATIREALKWASSRLQNNNIPEAEISAEVLLRYILEIDRTRLFMSLNQPLTSEDWYKFEDVVNRRSSGEPLQYIVGWQEFYGLPFKVNRDVLIPRPETEVLVEEICKASKRTWQGTSDHALVAADIGTGSGAIAVSLARMNRRWNIIAVDMSLSALQVARENAVLNGVERQISFFHGDLLQPIKQQGIKLDILVSNPPYIPTKEVELLHPQVKKFEPIRALDGGETGLYFYQRLIEDLPHVMKEPGLVGFEVGMGQADQVVNALGQWKKIKKIEKIKDLQGIERVVLASI
ncbi:peptide chain release factor N(5)-glutamine methyltransferase [Microaerobacter geothermalis]|uniref:peptide chain release factor N(5)-glutamine methyltransferase n=1 Tax=Microaerobacter geothermalis TaxID=674972 RepID=UPI001F17E975|nr:peptide chain release factor N(5)-glutamine methyltransferase [Microaerobacter geothermalis]MCF6093199.1 peptide chain release factor N(5)-glutamine methyltransferase [Microaerobacter geothermalis]